MVPVFGSDGFSGERVFCVPAQFKGMGLNGTVLVLILVSGRTVPTVPVSGSDSVRAPCS